MSIKDAESLKEIRNSYRGHPCTDGTLSTSQDYGQQLPFDIIKDQYQKTNTAKEWQF